MVGLGIVTQAAEVHDARDAGGSGSPAEPNGQLAVTLAKVSTTEGVHEVVGGVAPGQRVAEAAFIADVDDARLATRELAPRRDSATTS